MAPQTGIARRLAGRLKDRGGSGGRHNAVRVSVVVATYNTDAADLKRLVASFDAQSMTKEHRELVLVDDGSSADAVQRLKDLADSRADVSLQTIKHSGWPSRARNLGIERARGDFVMVMDHDDELFPDALQLAYDCAVTNEVDIVNGKEVRTGGWSWGWDAFVDDIPLAAPDDANALIPMTPHKLYRREFLLDNGVRFPEGARVLWEDNYFNLDARRAGARVAVVSSRPVFRWRIGTTNTTFSFEQDLVDFWTQLARYFDFIAAGPEPLETRRWLIRHYLISRVLTALGPKFPEIPADVQAEVYRIMRGIVEAHWPPELDARLRSVERCRVELLRLDRADLQAALSQVDGSTSAIPKIEQVEWDGGELVVHFTTTLADEAGDPVRLRRHGERWMRDLPEALTTVLSPDALDATADLAQAKVQGSVRSRSTHASWPLPDVSPVTCVDGVVSALGTLRFDPVAFAEAHGLREDVWDFGARLEVMGYLEHRALRGGGISAALLPDRPAVAYENQSGLFSLDVAGKIRSIIVEGRPDPRDARVTVRPDSTAYAVEVEIPLTGVHAPVDVRLAGETTLPSRTSTAELTAHSGDVVWTVRAVVPAGRYDLVMRLGKHTLKSGLTLVVPDDGTTARVEPITVDRPGCEE